MLKLINIKKTDEYIEADYIPENSTNTGHVKLTFKTGEEESNPAEGFERTYPRMAFEGLKRILDDLKKNSMYQIPNERLVMWY